MTDLILQSEPLEAIKFAPWGEVIEVSGAPDKIINQGMCGRHHDLAKLDFADGRAGISLFNAKARHLPLTLDMVERHPDGSQAFIPVTQTPFLVVVANDNQGTPHGIRAFVARAGQGVNLHRGVWHGVLTPLEANGIYAVIDRIGNGANLEEHWFTSKITIR